VVRTSASVCEEHEASIEHDDSLSSKVKFNRERLRKAVTLYGNNNTSRLFLLSALVVAMIGVLTLKELTDTLTRRTISRSFCWFLTGVAEDAVTIQLDAEEDVTIQLESSLSGLLCRLGLEKLEIRVMYLHV
jgi:hypothetical protein